MFEIEANDPHSRNQAQKYEALERDAAKYRWFQIGNLILIALTVIMFISKLGSIQKFKYFETHCGSPGSLEKSEVCRLYVKYVPAKYSSYMKEAIVVIEMLLWLSLILVIITACIAIWAYKARSYKMIYCVFVTYIVLGVVCAITLGIPEMLVFGVMVFGAYRLRIIFKEMQVINDNLLLQGIMSAVQHPN